MGMTLGFSGDGGIWTPAAIGGASLWLRPDLGLTVDGSSLTTNWVNQVGAKQSLIVPSGKTGPLYSATSGINGTPGLTFNGTSDCLYTTTAVWAADATKVVIVVASLSSGNISILTSRLKNGFYHDFMTYTLSGSTQIITSDCVAVNDTVAMTEAEIFIPAHFRWDYTTGGSTVVFRFNNDLKTVSGGNLSAETSISAGIAVGGRVDASGGVDGGTYMKGVLCEIIGTTGIISTGDWAAFRTYANKRYGL